MLLDWDKGLKTFGVANGFFLNNIFVLAVVYAATSLPLRFTYYQISSKHYQQLLKKQRLLTVQDILQQCSKL